jgi:hypothetical protein
MIDSCDIIAFSISLLKKDDRNVKECFEMYSRIRDKCDDLDKPFICLKLFWSAVHDEIYPFIKEDELYHLIIKYDIDTVKDTLLTNYKTRPDKLNSIISAALYLTALYVEYYSIHPNIFC